MISGHKPHALSLFPAISFSFLDFFDVGIRHIENVEHAQSHPETSEVFQEFIPKLAQTPTQRSVRSRGATFELSVSGRLQAASNSGEVQNFNPPVSGF
ncbi:hypothetical protein FGO68_gene6850 [Halteria grandinella]|uniref:Uncharacterized protein n=1 Tax=Halteria grandinella TaxID=5974 RepID=A0A8J8SV16_HALGN|nr:hypothetical protein FGO68_gene6850 [Halteria grandinella]